MNILPLLLVNLILLGSQIQQPDSDFIKLVRINGYGPRGGHSVTVYSTGTVEYLDTMTYVETYRRSYKIPKDSVIYLFNRVKEIRFFSLKPIYANAFKLQKNKNGSIDTLGVWVTDLPTQTVTVKIGDLTKSVVDYFRCFPSDQELKSFEAPEELQVFEGEIDRITHR